MSRQDANAAFALSSFLQGTNAAYIDDIYARYEKDPASVDGEWQEFFKSLKDSPADAAGIKPGDIIVEFNTAPVKDVTELQRRVAAVEPGRPTPLVVTRDKVSTPLTVKIGEQPGEETVATAQPREETLGLAIEPLTPEMGERFKLSARSGVVVTDVAPGSSGDQAGIRPGDAILEINRQPVKDVESFRRLIASVKPGETVPVYLQRGGGRNEYVVLSVPDSKR